MTRFTTYIVAGFSVVVLSAAAAPGSNPPREERLATYWGCTSGYQLQVAGTRVRCYRPAGTIEGAFLPCPNIGGVGFFPSTDHNGVTDMCAGTNPVTGQVAVERKCPVGYGKSVTRGPDRCTKSTPSDSRPPSLPVDL
jgi:hypothetical protein